MDEEIELEIGASEEVTLEHEELDSDPKGKWADHEVTVKNANPFAIRFELEFRTGRNLRYSKLSAPTERKPGKQVMVVIVPVNGEQKLRYRTAEIARTDD